MPRPKTPETDEDDDYVSDAEDELDGVLDGQEGEEYYSQAIQVAHLHEYFVTAFKMLGQLGCKDIGKAWIKTGHPKKQTTHPYNGGNTKQESLNQYGFAGALKTPDYWPPCEGWQDGKGCRHQEPDHIKKPGPSAFPPSNEPMLTLFSERLILLNHLLHCGHHRFTLDKLEKGTAQIEREIPKNFTAKSIKILKQIYYARRMEIRYEQNEIGGFREIPNPIVALMLLRWPHCDQSLPAEATSQGAKGAKGYHSATDQGRASTASSRQKKIGKRAIRGHRSRCANRGRRPRCCSNGSGLNRRDRADNPRKYACFNRIKWRIRLSQLTVYAKACSIYRTLRTQNGVPFFRIHSAPME